MFLNVGSDGVNKTFQILKENSLLSNERRYPEYSRFKRSETRAQGCGFESRWQRKDSRRVILRFLLLGTYIESGT